MSHRLACYSPSFRIPRKPQKPSQQLRKKKPVASADQSDFKSISSMLLLLNTPLSTINPPKMSYNHLVIHSYYASCCCCCCCKKGSQIGSLVSIQVITAGHNEWMDSTFLKMNLRLRSTEIMFNLSHVVCLNSVAGYMIFLIYIYI